MLLILVCFIFKYTCPSFCEQLIGEQFFEIKVFLYIYCKISRSTSQYGTSFISTFDHSRILNSRLSVDIYYRQTIRLAFSDFLRSHVWTFVWLCISYPDWIWCWSARWSCVCWGCLGRNVWQVRCLLSPGWWIFWNTQQITVWPWS